MGTMEEVQKLLSEGRTPKEVINMGFPRSTVYAVARKAKRKTGERDFEVDIEVYELIDQVARWVEVFITAFVFDDKTKPVPCLYCAFKGEKDFMMKEKKDRFECPRCGETLWFPGRLSKVSTVRLVMEAIKRGARP